MPNGINLKKNNPKGVQNEKNKMDKKANYEIDKNKKLTNYAGLGIIINFMEALDIFKELSINFGMKVRKKVYSEFSYLYLILIS